MEAFLFLKYFSLEFEIQIPFSTFAIPFLEGSVFLEICLKMPM